jgi:DNA recombination protein RmuC
MEIVFAIVGVIVGVVVGVLLQAVRTGALRTQVGVLESQLAETKNAGTEALRQLEESHRRVFAEREKANAELMLSKEKSFLETLADKENAYKKVLADKESAYEKVLADKESSYEKVLADKESTHAKIIADKEGAYEKAIADMAKAHELAFERQEQHNREALNALQKRFDETVAKMKAELENVTAEMLKRRQSEFETTSREGVSKILEPLNASIREMREAVADNTVKHSEFGGKLAENIRLVMEHSDAARKSADRLADALRGGGKIQGDWGEKVLTELLESQGLTEGVHFDTQPTLRDAAGNAIRSENDRLLRPDVILHLDRERDVVIDAKVSLSAFMDYKAAESEEARETALRNHVTSVENHVKELSRKDYSSYIGAGKVRMDYVIMFVPNTTALYAATLKKPDLWRKAMEKGVYIADEQTLYAALRIIDMTWRQIAQAENHEKVYSLANEMLERVNMFMEKFVALGKKLEDAQKSYGDAMAKIGDSGQSIPVTCRKLIKLGATVKQPRKGVSPELIGLSADTPAEG